MAPIPSANTLVNIEINIAGPTSERTLRIIQKFKLLFVAKIMESKINLKV